MMLEEFDPASAPPAPAPARRHKALRHDQTVPASSMAFGRAVHDQRHRLRAPARRQIAGPSILTMADPAFRTIPSGIAARSEEQKAILRPVIEIEFDADRHENGRLLSATCAGGSMRLIASVVLDKSEIRNSRSAPASSRSPFRPERV